MQGNGGQRSLAAGIPVLGSRYASAAEELICDNEVGRLFDPLVPGSLDEALAATVRDGQWVDTSPARLRAALKGYNCGMATEVILDAAQSALACRSKRGGS
jgi:glycosyltransferase involved in cell wall biosynthesis